MLRQLRAPRVTVEDRGRHAAVLDHTTIWPAMPADFKKRLPRIYLGGEGRQLGDMLERARTHYDLAIKNLIREGINKGKLVGDDAFRAIGFIASDQICHGSVVLPENLREGKLLPHQARWRDTEGTYLDGAPAVCFTPDQSLASFVALAGSGVPELDGEFRAFGLAPRPYGLEQKRREWVMMSQVGLSRILGNSGVVYTRDQESTPLYTFDHPMRMPEHRTHEPTDYDYAVRVTTANLPPSMLVVDANQTTMEDMWREIVLDGTHPLDLKGYPPIATLGGDWDIHDTALYRHAVPA